MDIPSPAIRTAFFGAARFARPGLIFWHSKQDRIPFEPRGYNAAAGMEERVFAADADAGARDTGSRMESVFYGAGASAGIASQLSGGRFRIPGFFFFTQAALHYIHRFQLT